MTNRFTIFLASIFALVTTMAQKPSADESFQRSCPFAKIEPQRLPDLNIPRFGQAVFYANGELTVAGGHTSGFIPTPTAEYLKGGEWHLMQMTYNHDDGICVPLRSGQVLLAGGYEKNLGVGQTIEAELYDPATHTFHGFGCMAMRRAHCSGIEIDSGKVVVSGNWYHDDGIEMYEGKMHFTPVKETSRHRSIPYLFRTSDGNVIIVNGSHDNYGNIIQTDTVDRLKGEPFTVPLLKKWHAILVHHTPNTTNCLIGDDEQGDYTYLFPVEDESGQVAIAEVHDTIFSLLPTECPIPMRNQWGDICWNTPITIDRQAQRGYMLGHEKDNYTKNYVLCFDYSKRPASLMAYYTDYLPGFSGTIPLVTENGDLVIAGGVDGHSDNFTPSAAVWLLPVGNNSTASSSSWWFWLLGGVILLVILIALLAYFFIYAKRQKTVQEETPPTKQTPKAPKPASVASGKNEEMRQRILHLIIDEKKYLDSDLTTAAVADMLGIHRNYISTYFPPPEGPLSQIINNQRVEHAKRLMRQNPDMKINSIGRESGFSNETSFYRTFKDLTGMTPTEWKSTID